MRRFILAVAFLVAVSVVPAQSPSSDEAAIRAALDAQAAAWNRADIPTFMKTYEDVI